MNNATPPLEYLVNHGRTAFVGRFRNGANAAFGHGERVVVRSARGLEVGTILSESATRYAHLLGEGEPGDILRRSTVDDDRREAELEQVARRLLPEVQTTADQLGLPVAILDLEILLEGTPAIVQVLPLEECDLTALVETLAQRHGLKFAIQNLHVKSVPEPEGKGCGKPGCGSSGGGCTSCGTGGGCSTGSCSSGSVKNAEELTAYFGGLRRQMEAQSARVPLHG